MAEKKKKKPTKTTNTNSKKPAAPKKTSLAAKKPAAPKRQQVLKHSDKDELIVSSEKPIIIKKGAGKEKKKRPSRRELKRVANVGGYTVFDGARTGKTFATPKEAALYAVDVFRRTGEFVDVAKTDRQVSHTFKAASEHK